MILVASLANRSFHEHINVHGDRLIKALSIATATFVALFFGVALILAKPAAAAEACGGSNLLAEITDRDVLAKIDADAAAIPNGNGILWRIGKQGPPDSYLFGTMHVSDPRVVNLPAKVEAAFDEAEILVIETTDVLDPAKASQAMMKRPDLMMFTDGNSLEKLIAAEDIAMVNEELTKRGMPLAAVKTLKPWMLTSMLATPACEASRKAGGAEILDIGLATKASAAGKPVLGLETMEEQVSAMASLPMKDHINGLVETLRMSDIGDDVFETMLTLYAAGDTARILPALNAALEMKTGNKADPDLAAQAAFEEKMITNRNTTMVERLPEHLEKGGVFVAIGALHLPGELGVIQQLKNAGYDLEAIK